MSHAFSLTRHIIISLHDTILYTLTGYKRGLRGTIPIGCAYFPESYEGARVQACSKIAK